MNDEMNDWMNEWSESGISEDLVHYDDQKIKHIQVYYVTKCNEK